MFKVKYGRHYFKSTYKTNFSTKVIINYLKIKLFFKRILRCIKRMLQYNVFNLITIIFIFSIILIVIFIGIYIKEYENILCGLWDLKGILITNVLLILFMTTYSSEKQRHNILKKQYDVYLSVMCEAEFYIDDLLEIMNHRVINNIFIDEGNYDCFIEELNGLTKNIKGKFDMNTIYNKLNYLNNKYKNRFSNYLLFCDDKLVGANYIRIRELIFDSMDEELYLIQNNSSKNINTSEIIDYIRNISYTLYGLVAECRRPWRWDIKVDKKMRNLLENNAKFIKGNYNSLLYYEMPIIQRDNNYKS